MLDDGLVRSAVRNYQEQFEIDNALHYLATQDSIQLSYDADGMPTRLAVGMHHSLPGGNQVDYAAYTATFTKSNGVITKIDYAYSKRFPQDTGSRVFHIYQIALTYGNTPVVKVSPLPWLLDEKPHPHENISPVSGYPLFLGDRIPTSVVVHFRDAAQAPLATTYQITAQVNAAGFPTYLKSVISYSESAFITGTRNFYAYDCD